MLKILNIVSTDYGRPMKPFFFEIPNFCAWAGAFGVFSAKLSAPILGTVSPLSMFSIIQPLFLQKTKPLYPHPKYLPIWDWDLNSGRKELGI